MENPINQKKTANWKIHKYDVYQFQVCKALNWVLRDLLKNPLYHQVISSFTHTSDNRILPRKEQGTLWSKEQK